MNDRSTALRLIAVGPAGYGVYTAGYVPAMLLDQPEPALLIGFVLQVLCALAATLGVWRGQPRGRSADDGAKGAAPQSGRRVRRWLTGRGAERTPLVAHPRLVPACRSSRGRRAPSP